MNSYLKKVNPCTLLLCLIALFPILPMGVISLNIILFAGLSVLLFFLKKIKIKDVKSHRKWLLVTTGFYLWLVLAVIYSPNPLYGIEKLQSSLALFIFPITLFFFIDKVPTKLFDLMNKCFVAANLILTLFLHYYFYSKGIYSNLETVTFWNSPIREALAANEFKDLHPTYLSLWFLYSVLYLLDKLVTNYTKMTKSLFVVVTLTIALFLVTTILLSTRMSMIAFFIALLTYIFFKLKNKIIKYVTITLTIATVVVAVFNVSYLKSRIIDEFKVTELKPPIGETHNSVNIRVGIYQCSLDVLKQSWFLGVGHGNVQEKLNNCYEQFQTGVYKKTNYNSHNQYLHYFIAGGIICLVLFCIMFLKQFKLALLNRDFLYLSFLVLVFCSFLSENMLVRLHGVLFYALFNTLFIKKWIQPQEK